MASINIDGDNDEMTAEKNNQMSSLSVGIETPSKMRKSSHSSNELELPLIHSEKHIQVRSVPIFQAPRQKVGAYSRHNDYAASNAASNTG